MSFVYHGKNRKKESIKMTAPVNQKASSEKIAMTAPVNQQKAEGKYSVSFLMPSKYTMETLPEPLDSNVRLREIPAHKIVAIRYSGFWSKKKYEAKKALLEQFVEKKGLRVTGGDIFARYDPVRIRYSRYAGKSVFACYYGPVDKHSSSAFDNG